MDEGCLCITEEVSNFESTLLVNGSRSRKDFTSNNMASLVGSPKYIPNFTLSLHFCL